MSSMQKSHDLAMFEMRANHAAAMTEIKESHKVTTDNFNKLSIEIKESHRP